MIGDFWGGKHLQTVALVGTALGTGAVALGGSTSVVGLSLIYAGMGLLCGPQHPTAAKMVADWTLPSERNWASGDSSRLHYRGTAVTAAESSDPLTLLRVVSKVTVNESNSDRDEGTR